MNSNVKSIQIEQEFFLKKMTSKEIKEIIKPEIGLVIFNTTENTLSFFDGKIWRRVTSGKLK